MIDFHSGHFYTFSDHSPRTFTLNYCPAGTCNDADNNVTDFNNDNTRYRTRCKTVTWSSDAKLSMSQCLQNILPAMCDISDMNMSSQSDVDRCVTDFCQQINDIVLPYCLKEAPPITRRYKNNNKHRKKKTGDKPWFNDTCKQKYREYKKALYEFNACKSDDRHRNLL